MNKKYTVPCEVIQDLLPSYVDGLTSEVTDQLVKEHLETCEDCKQIYRSMTDPEPEVSEEDRKEIDYLKKNKKKNRKTIIGVIAACLILGLGILGLRYFVIGTKGSTGWIACDVQVNEEKTLILDGQLTDSGSGISKVVFEEKENGEIYVTTREVIASSLHSGSFHETYQAKEPVRQVWLNGRIIWSEGQTIASDIFDLYETRHDYVGDMPANQKTANALRISDRLGPYTNELETESEPYGWKLILSEDMKREEQAAKQEDMQAIAAVLIGLVGNLDHVTFEGTVEGEPFFWTINEERANDLYDLYSVKNAAQSIAVLNRIVGNSSLLRIDGFDQFSPDTVRVEDNQNGSVSEKDPVNVARLYSLVKEMRMTGERLQAFPEDGESTDPAKGKSTLNIWFIDSETGSNTGCCLKGAYLLKMEDGQYYWKEVENGQNIYDTFLGVLKKVNENG